VVTLSLKREQVDCFQGQGRHGAMKRRNCVDLTVESLFSCIGRQLLFGQCSLRRTYFFCIFSRRFNDDDFVRFTSGNVWFQLFLDYTWIWYNVALGYKQHQAYSPCLSSLCLPTPSTPNTTPL
jgi:hypothetical protein